MTPPDAGRRAYAGLVSRITALATDAVALTLAALALTTLPGLAWSQVAGSTPRWLTTACAVLAVHLPFLYFTSCWWLVGHTLGDLLVGIQIRSRDGGEVGLVRAALRAYLGLLLAPVWVAGMFSVLTDERRRAWHDRVFGTEVRYAPRARAVRRSQ